MEGAQHITRLEALGVKRSPLSFVEQRADVILISALSSCFVLFLSAQFHRGQFILLLHLGHQSCFDTCARLWCLGGAATRAAHEDELYCVIFFVQFHSGSLHAGVVPFGTVCKDFWRNSFYTKRMQSCSCVLASLCPTSRLFKLLLRSQESHKWVGQLSYRCAADGSFRCWLFYPSEAVLQRSF